MRFLKDLTIGFSSGALAGLLQSIIFWLIVHFELTQYIQVSFTVPDQWSEIHVIFLRDLLWGAILGLLLAIPLWESAWIKRGLLLGLIPSLFILLYVFPYMAHSGMFGMNHGNFAFAVILALGEFYGLMTSGWFNWVRNG